MTTDERPWRCPRDSSCPAPSHDKDSGYRCGCRSELALRDTRRVLKRRQAGLRPIQYQPSHLTARRLQALAALGWSARHLAHELGITKQALQQLRTPISPRVRTSTAARVYALYQQLEHTPGPSDPTRRAAHRAGWAAPAAWDDIDDPHATPCTGTDSPEDQPDGGVVEAALGLGLRWDTLADDLRAELLDGLYQRLGSVELADRVHTQPLAITRAWERLKAARRRDAARAAHADNNAA